jgi:hypothetical protein
MQLSCPSCRSPIPAADVHLPSGRAKCRACDAVFRLAGGDAAAAAAPPRTPLPRPAALVELPGAAGVRYEHRWWSARYLFLVLFCVLWDGFLIVWYAIALGTGERAMILFPLIHVAAGIGITYYTICGFVNRSTVTLHADRLDVEHGPLPWPGNRSLPTGRIRQLYTEMQTHQGKHGTTHTFRLSAVMDDGSSVRLLSGIQDAAVPRYLEQELESRMGIVDVPVAGQLAP